MNIFRISTQKKGKLCQEWCKVPPTMPAAKMNENENVGVRAQCVSSTNTKC